jgi:peptide/nickel transport system permease protein
LIALILPLHNILNLDNAVAKRIAGKLSNDDRLAMKDWLVADGIPEEQIDITDTKKLLDQWESNYDPKKKVEGMTFAKQRYYQRVNASIAGLLSTEGVTLAVKNPQTGVLEQTGIVKQSDYVNVGQVSNVRFLPLGTDNFGRDVLTEHGKIVERGSADEVILHPKETYTQRLINDVPKIYEEWDLSTV